MKKVADICRRHGRELYSIIKRDLGDIEKFVKGIKRFVVRLGAAGAAH